MIDLGSDTVTRPTPAMRRAMAGAEVGDDAYGEDPTVNRLQERAAEVFEKEAALFVPAGSMANQVAVKLRTRPGVKVDRSLCAPTSSYATCRGRARRPGRSAAAARRARRPLLGLPRLAPHGHALRRLAR